MDPIVRKQIINGEQIEERLYIKTKQGYLNLFYTPGQFEIFKEGKEQVVGQIEIPKEIISYNESQNTG